MLHPALSDVVVSEEWGLHGAKVNAGDLAVSSKVEFSSGLDGQHYDPQLVGLNQGVAVVWTHESIQPPRPDLTPQVADRNADHRDQS